MSHYCYLGCTVLQGAEAGADSPPGAAWTRPHTIWSPSWCFSVSWRAVRFMRLWSALRHLEYSKSRRERTPESRENVGHEHLTCHWPSAPCHTPSEPSAATRPWGLSVFLIIYGASFLQEVGWKAGNHRFCSFPVRQRQRECSRRRRQKCVPIWLS